MARGCDHRPVARDAVMLSREAASGRVLLEAPRAAARVASRAHHSRSRLERFAPAATLTSRSQYQCHPYSIQALARAPSGARAGELPTSGAAAALPGQGQCAFCARSARLAKPCHAASGRERLLHPPFSPSLPPSTRSGVVALTESGGREKGAVGGHAVVAAPVRRYSSSLPSLGTSPMGIHHEPVIATRAAPEIAILYMSTTVAAPFWLARPP